MSNGSDTLTFRDPATFAIDGHGGGHRRAASRWIDLNELECVDGAVWANVWETPYIVRIDPATGVVTGALDTTGLLVPDPSVARSRRGAQRHREGPRARTRGCSPASCWPEAIEVRITEP